MSTMLLISMTTQEMRTYQCEACGYKFKATRLHKICPYCGKEGTVKPVKDAETILKEVDQENQGGYQQ